MPGNPPPFESERDNLLAYLTQQRDGLKYAAYGLTEEQLRSTPTRSRLSVGGLLKHAAHTERMWTQILLGRPEIADAAAYFDTFSLAESDSLEGLVAGFDEVASGTTQAVNGIEDLGVRVQLPAAPWYPQDPEGHPARWILLHVIEELARHAGHADIIREHIDGATMFELMAGAEGWPESEWIKPWKPSAGESAATG